MDLRSQILSYLSSQNGKIRKINLEEYVPSYDDQEYNDLDSEISKIDISELDPFQIFKTN